MRFRGTRFSVARTALQTTFAQLDLEVSRAEEILAGLKLSVVAGEATLIAAHAWDVVGARAAGLDSIWVDRLERRWPLPVVEPRRAASLLEAVEAFLSSG